VSTIACGVIGTEFCTPQHFVRSDGNRKPDPGFQEMLQLIVIFGIHRLGDLIGCNNDTGHAKGELGVFFEACYPLELDILISILVSC
jgi:hypothetical protein